MFSLFECALTFTFVSVVSSTGVSCSSITNLNIPGTNILSITGNIVLNYTVPAVPPVLLSPINGLNFCSVTVVLTHPNENDTVTTTIWLPLSGWNGRFQGTGGGGFSAGLGPLGLGSAIQGGYSAGSTDGGNLGLFFDILPAALTSNGSINWPLIEDFGSRSVHDMAVIGKAVTEQYYGTPPLFSYFGGCSNGGREGYAAAQKYPRDFDGVMAASPVPGFAKISVAAMWPYTVMVQEKTVPSECVFNAFVNASIAQCDGLDGVLDGIISDVESCFYDPYTLVGKQVACDGEIVTIDEATSKVVQMVHDGLTSPSGEKLWSGQNWGTGFVGLYVGNLATSTQNGTTTPIIPEGSSQYIKYLLKRDPSFDISSLSYADLTALFHQSVAEYEAILGAGNPDLSGFRDAGGKLLSWHGLADSLIYPNGTVLYRQEVDALMGGTEAVSEFYRLFLAPGVNHCGGGYGPVPTDPLGALVAWVENGTVPETIAGQFTDGVGDVVWRDICYYPLVSRYDGHGDPKVASSYDCSTSRGLV
ncbi:putative feruloyl esterase [Lachnellula suecica]|uniref:Carboxylic ester hydrolase n=1 Tax=Lachnellula suecica TaxID=602035 RepID=A0A8T9C646_9HELO|nr:putative feruloyl esterase [Lachnellula suecica]